MYKNYVLIAIRNLKIRKQFTILTIFGMAVGISCALIAFLFSSYEFSYENWIPDSASIYRIDAYYHYPGGRPRSTALIGVQVGPTITDYFSEILTYTRTATFDKAILIKDNQSFFENLTYADTNLLEFFSMSLIKGSKDTVLDAHSLLLSQSMAQKYFGAIEIVGETLTFVTYNNNTDYKIVGVFKDLPGNTHLKIDFITHYSEAVFTKIYAGLKTFKSWNFSFFVNYIKLQPGASITAINKGIADYTNHHYITTNTSYAGTKPTELLTYKPISIKDIHLYSPHDNNSNRVSLVYAYSVIALLILLIAVINYASLATATSSLRAREITMRKVMGANLRQIRTQFLSESIVNTLIASFLALLLCGFTLPYLNDFLTLESGSLSLKNSFATWLLVPIMGVGTGLIAGLYPAFYLASLKPAKVLSNNTSAEKTNSGLRLMLVVLQFTVVIGLLVVLGVVSRQTQFINKMDVGYNKTNINILRINNEMNVPRVPTLIQQIRALPSVAEATASFIVPTDGRGISATIKSPELLDEKTLAAKFITIDMQFFEFYGIRPLAGRLLSPAYAEDFMEKMPLDASELRLNILANEAGIKLIGIPSPEQALGTRITLSGHYWKGSDLKATIVGVLPDVNFGSVYNKVSPLFFLSSEDAFWVISIKPKPDSVDEMKQDLKRIWQAALPDMPMQLDHLETLVARQYQRLHRQGILLFILSGLAVILSCIGLYGMATFSVERRTKEIGIRKALGASMIDIVTLFILHFSKPVFIAMLIAWPISGFLMHQWLQSFAVRIDLNLLYFLLAGIFVLLITWLTVGGHALKAAHSKPIKALHHE